MGSALIEPAPQAPGWRRVLADLGPTEWVNGTVGFLFAATGPAAIVLSVARGGGLDDAQTASWIFAIFAVNGLITLALSWRYHQPLCFFWTIPGTVLVGPALRHLSFAEVLGAFWATSLLVLLLGASGAMRGLFRRVPMPLVMAMVAGVLLRFGLDVVRALHADPVLAGVMLAAFLGLGALPRVARVLPPILVALVLGGLLTWSGGKMAPGAFTGLELAVPQLVMPAFSLNAMLELVVPVAITILVIQNGQGLAVLTGAGHATPVNVVTLACGLGGMASAALGAIGTCLTGPTNGIITASGARERHYAAAMVTGALALGFGFLAPTVCRLMLACPKELVMMLGGLAMLRVLQGAFAAAFKGPCGLGALVTFLVTLADLPLLGIGAPFWGLVAGFMVSLLLERSQMSAPN